jgi:hypothetical protein
MTKTLDSQIKFAEVQGVIKRSLALEGDSTISEDTIIVQLGSEPIDILEICSELRIPLSQYTSGGSLKDTYKPQMMKIAEEAGRRKDSIKNLAKRKTAKEFAEKVAAGDLYAMAQYYRRQED